MHSESSLQTEENCLSDPDETADAENEHDFQDPEDIEETPPPKREYRKVTITIGKEDSTATMF